MNETANYAWIVPVAGNTDSFVVRCNDARWHLGYLHADGAQGFPEHMSVAVAVRVAQNFNGSTS